MISIDEDPASVQTAAEEMKEQISLLSPPGQVNRITHQPSQGVTVFLGLVCLVALSLTAYLSWTAATATKVFGCGGDIFDCSHVLNSRWSTWFGVPVGVPAFFLYAGCLAALAFVYRGLSQKSHRQAWSFITVGALVAGFSAIWFISLQLFLIHHLCHWCLAAHSCGIIMAGVVLWTQPSGQPQTLQLAAISLFGVGVLIGGQLLTTPPPTYQIERYDTSPTDGSDGNHNVGEGDLIEAPIDEPDKAPTSQAVEQSFMDTTHRMDEPLQAGVNPLMIVFLLLATGSLLSTQHLPAQDAGRRPDARSSDSETAEGRAATRDTVTPGRNESERFVEFAGGKKLDVRKWPLVGRPEARYIFVEMFDYTCPHCRASHANAIRGALERYGDRLAIVMLPVPLEASCNSTVQTTGAEHVGACEISRIAVAVWRLKPPVFPDFHDWLMSQSRTPAAAMTHAGQLVGAESLREELARPTAGQYVSKHIELYRQLGAGTVPKLLFPRATLTGDVGSTATLCNTIERELGLPNQ